MPRGIPNKKITEEKPQIPQPTPPLPPPEGTIQISKAEWDKMQEQIKMLTAVADKGRMFNYESQQASLNKKPMKVNLSVYNDKYIIGWKTNKDQLVYHPTTGATVGEQQEYEITLISKDGVISTALINSYKLFSDARYDKRVECEVIGKTENYNGEIEFEVLLPDGQKVKLSSRFIN